MRGDRSGTWFRGLADHMGEAYLRYSFTKGTRQETEFLVDALELAAGSRVLDVGCGPGRHVLALRERGIDAVGLDISESFCRLLAPEAPAVVGDVRALPFGPCVDAVVSLCQGGFGLLGGPGAPLDAEVAAMREMAGVLRPGGRLCVSAFSSYFQVRHQHGAEVDAGGGTFDADAGVMHERTTVKDPQGNDLEADLWTTGFTPRELRLLATAAGLRIDGVWSVTPGDYARRSPGVDHPELLLLATRVG